MSTSIDDLLSFGEEPAGEDVRPSGGGRARLLLRTAAVTAAVVVVVVVLDGVTVTVVGALLPCEPQATVSPPMARTVMVPAAADHTR